MDDETITIDVEKLREDLTEDSMGAFFGGGYGGAFMQAMDISSASDEEIVQIAIDNGVDLYDYEV